MDDPRAWLDVQAEIGRWLAGLVAIPTLHHLGRGGAWDVLTRGAADLRRLGAHLCADRPGHNLGSLLGGLRVLALNGWVAIEGRDEASRVRLTAAGRVVAERWRVHEDVFAEAVDFLAFARDFPTIFRSGGEEAEAAAALERLVAESRRGYGLDGDGDPVVSLLRQQLDGLVISPVVVAIGIPVHRQERDAIRVAQPSLLERVDASGRIPLRRAAAGWNRRLLRAALTLLAQQRLVERDPAEPGALRLTPRGRLVAADAANFGGPVSYLPNYSRLEDVLLGSGDPCGIAEDGHVDRVMNIWTSYEHSVFTMARSEICASIVRRIFDDPDLDRQPAGIADMGCGSGDSARQVVDSILHGTLRGRHLATHPLTVIGADYYEAPRARARATFQALSAIPGVRAEVVAADVSDPDGYDATIRGLGLQTVDRRSGRRRRVGAADFLHTLMFLSHDRELRVTEPDQAMEVVRRAVGTTDRTSLRRALEPLIGAAGVPEDEDLLVRLVAEQFTTAHSDRGLLVPALVSAADLIEFMRRWRPYLTHGMVLLEVHVVRAQDLLGEGEVLIDRPLPDAAQPSAAAWGVHYASRQFLLPHGEHELALTLAGFEARDVRTVLTENLTIGWWVDRRGPDGGPR